jgi:hypothetical protein
MVATAQAKKFLLGHEWVAGVDSMRLPRLAAKDTWCLSWPPD